MLKITSRNEKFNRRMAHKETTHLLHKFFRCFFVQLTQRQGSKRYQLFISQWQRYCLHWQTKLLFHSPFTKTRTICFLTGRSRSIYRSFRLSRLKIRSYAATGHFVGLSKASW